MKSGWRRQKGTLYHWFDNDALWSICGALPAWIRTATSSLYPLRGIEYRRTRPAKDVCRHCRRMIGGKGKK